jgi:hypothetical protein
MGAASSGQDDGRAQSTVLRETHELPARAGVDATLNAGV